MKKGMLARSVLTCVLLVGAPACKHKKDHSKAPPSYEKTHKKAAKKGRIKNKKDAHKMAKSACCARPPGKGHK